MTGIFTSALTGLFVWSSVATGPLAVASTTKIVIPELPTYSVSMTGYNAVPEQTDGDPMTTASGAYSNPEIIAARSLDLADELPFGTVIEIIAQNSTSTPNCGFSVVKKYMGLRVIGDSMHPRKRNQIDVMFHTEPVVRAAGRVVNPAVALGVCKGIEIRVVGKVSIKSIPKTQKALRLAVGLLKEADEQQLAIKK